MFGCRTRLRRAEDKVRPQLGLLVRVCSHRLLAGALCHRIEQCLNQSIQVHFRVFVCVPPLAFPRTFCSLLKPEALLVGASRSRYPPSRAGQANAEPIAVGICP
jgi:hypothetical protein